MSQPQERAEGRRRTRNRFGAAASLAAHLGLAIVVMAGFKSGPRDPEAQPVTVSLLPPFPVAPAEPKLAPAAAAPAGPPPKPAKIKPRPGSPKIQPLVADKEPEEEPAPVLSEAQLAGAATAGTGDGGGGSGGGGGGCNMVRLLQTALRKDNLVHAAAASAGSRAIMVWNGDWVRNSSEDGKGLAAVREALIWEIAFAPEACRREPVRGLVLISLNDQPGGARLVLGSGQWRWSDLTHAKSAMPRVE